MTTPRDITDLDSVVLVHLDAFPGFFMTQLGPAFLREYYRCVLDYSGGVLLTEHGLGGCIGFVAGFVDPMSFYQELRRRRLRLGVAMALGLLSRPARIMTLVGNYQRAGRAARQNSEPGVAELSSLAVVPGAAARGTGSRLVRRFVSAVQELGSERVVLTTDAFCNEKVNRFYQKLGFACVRTFEARRGRWLNEYVLNIRRD